MDEKRERMQVSRRGALVNAEGDCGFAADPACIKARRGKGEELRLIKRV